MRHKYATEAIVLGRTQLGEASSLVSLLTNELGLIRARAQGVRKPGAKLSAALTTLAESDVILVKGKEGWRLSGAILAHDHFADLGAKSRERAGRIATLMLRILTESGNEGTYHLYKSYLETLGTLNEEEQDALETLAALYLLQEAGLDAGEVVPQGDGKYGKEAREYALGKRKELITRINRGIEASGL